MSDQKNTPGADSPLPEEAGNPTAFPDLSAHSDSPAWLSADGSHDTGLWERTFADSGAAADTGAQPVEPAGADADETPGKADEAPGKKTAVATAVGAVLSRLADRATRAGKGADSSEAVAGTGSPESAERAERAERADDDTVPAEAADDDTVTAEGDAVAAESAPEHDAVHAEGADADSQSTESAGDNPSAESSGVESTADEPGDMEDDVELPPEPVVVAPEELELEEPSLAEPALSSDAVEAAELEDVASETAAVEANAAEAGRLSGLEPAPAGAEIRVDPAAEEAAETDPEAPDAAQAGPGSPETGREEPAAEEAVGEEPAAEEAVGEEPAAEEAVGEEPAAEEVVGEEPAAEEAAVEEPAAEDTEEGAGNAPSEARSDAGPKDAPGLLHGINAAAPVTDALPAQDKAEAEDTPEPEPTTASVPTGDTRRSRRLAESQAAAAAAGAARKPKADATGQMPAVEEPGAPAPAPATAAGPAKGTGRRNTKLLLVIGGVVLAAVVAILLVVFVFNGKGEGVVSENVSPVDLEAGACLQDWEDVNSTADVVTCETPHHAQLVASERFEGSDDFPGTAALEDRVNEVCAAVDYADSASSYPDLKVAKSIPTEQTWSNGDRRLDCFVFSPEGQELTESLIRTN
ncbi:septum formation family protein [Arthrobacter sp. zg-Y20]|uniref:septum formation family protein n=1 Tax=unclassified Arthrobacter TaxID=235627 RepID=UPI001D14B4E0|nr:MULTISPECIES: septum formation family protein [unclassified Arthrobacter]MCC3275839.1 septum formation family protein [Arthrobacter sp. zg-Y20]MDK1315996.1 septum formation family protein [Arthrobacter sp. zg.Y20]WIB05708.1 septum formation family protein [Arthrobacter sp. zg-Y20]